MTSCSPGFSPVIAACTSSRSWARSAWWLTSADSSATYAVSSSMADAFPARRRRWHSFRATANSQGRSLSGSRSSPALAAAMTNVS